MSNNNKDCKEKEKGEQEEETFAVVTKRKLGVLVDEVEARIKVLEEKELAIAEVERRMKAHVEAANNKITLDVGGKRFATSKDTLLSSKGSFFEAMLGSGNWKPDVDGSYFIDRNPKLFPVILDFLRSGKVNMRKYGYDIGEELQAELDFYQIQLPEAAIPFGIFAESKLLDLEQKKKIVEWLGRKPITTFLYCASRDGFGASAFHLKCDNKGATVVIIKSSNGFVFGGYSATSWDSMSGYRGNPSTFLFTLTNPHNIPPTRYSAKSNDNNSIFCHSTYGPTFGSGHDIYICNNSNVSGNNCSSYFPGSYQDSTGRGQATFTGAFNFQTSEIEVFGIEQQV